jgi:hypothetical protein
VKQKVTFVAWVLLFFSAVSTANADEYGVAKWLAAMADRSNVQSEQLWYLPQDGRESSLRLLDALEKNYGPDRQGVRDAIKQIVDAMGESYFLDLRIHVQLGWFLNAKSASPYRDDDHVKNILGIVKLNAVFAEFQVKRWLADPALLERYTHLIVWSGVADRMTVDFLQSVPYELNRSDGAWRKTDRRYWPRVRGYLVCACLTNRHLQVDEDDLELSFRKWWKIFDKSVSTSGRIRASRLSPTWVLNARQKASAFPELIVRPATPYPGQTEDLDLAQLFPKKLRDFMHEF